MRLIFPTRELIGLEPGNGAEWNQWVPEWLDLWDSMIHVDFWNAAWSCIFARLAKHDRNSRFLAILKSLIHLRSEDACLFIQSHEALRRR